MRFVNVSFLSPFPVSDAFGVSQNPDPVSSVRGIDGASWNNKRPCGVSFAFQVRKHLVEAHADVSSNILKHTPSGPDGSHEPFNFWPEVTVIFRAFSLPGRAEWLAWISSANNVNMSNCIGG